MKPQAHQPDTSLKKRKLNRSLTCRKQVVEVVYLQRHLLLIQRTNQMRVNVRPLLLHETFFPVLPDVIQTFTGTHTQAHRVNTCMMCSGGIFQEASNRTPALFDTLMYTCRTAWLLLYLSMHQDLHLIAETNWGSLSHLLPQLLLKFYSCITGCSWLMCPLSTCRRWERWLLPRPHWHSERS